VVVGMDVRPLLVRLGISVSEIGCLWITEGYIFVCLAISPLAYWNAAAVEGGDLDAVAASCPSYSTHKTQASFRKCKEANSFPKSRFFPAYLQIQ